MSDVMNIDILWIADWEAWESWEVELFEAIISQLFSTRYYLAHFCPKLRRLVSVFVFVLGFVFVFVFVMSICTKMELFEVIIWDLFVQNCAEPAASHLRWRMKDSHVIRFKNSKKLDRWNVPTIIKFLLFNNCSRGLGLNIRAWKLYEM